jgi:CubicO group peptidase (beta-lactamase class C family)
MSAASCLLGLVLLAPAAPPDAAAYDAVLDDALKAWRAPGIAAAVVRDDEVIYLHGAGVRELGGKEPVTPDTLFGIGSLTKAFTATAIAQLVDDGAMDWDDPVRKHLPTFRLSDPLADRDVTIRDLLCHRTGLARHDLLYYRAPWTVEETVRRMAHLELNHSFRSTYEYNNLCYMAAGLAVSSAAKQPWHEFMRKRLFDPLGMGGAVFTRADALKADHAAPHRRNADDKVEAIPWYDDDKQIRASGSIKAGVRDLSKWMRLQLNDGVFEGKRIVSKSALAETHAPQVVVPPDAELAKQTEATQVSYGLGWRVTDYRGKALWEHGGAVDGFRAHILLAPKDKVGVVVLTNLEDAEITDAVGYSLLDLALGLPKKDWNAFYAGRLKDADAARQARAESRAASRKPGTKPSREAEAYAGTYEEPGYGAATVVAKEGKLTLKWSSYEKPLKHFHYDTFIVDEPDVRGASRLAGELTVFELNADGDPDVLRFLGRKFKRK